MNITPFRGLLPNLQHIPDQELFFNTVKESYSDFHRSGYFTPRQSPAFYVFRIQSPGRQSTGLICTTHVTDYLEGRVLKHERTIHSKEQLQIALLLERDAAVKPVLLMHRRRPVIREWLADFALRRQPVLRVDFPDGDSHFLWKVDQADEMEQIRQLFRQKLPAVAIADGHHRLSCFATLWQQQDPEHRAPFEAVLSAYFPEDELDIAAFHRHVELPTAFDGKQLLQQLQALGTLSPLASARLPSHKHHMSIKIASQWCQFSWAPSLLSQESAQRPVLDVDLLDRHILGPLFGIRDTQADARLHYIEGTEDLRQLAVSIAKLPEGVTFVLHPIHPHDFLQIARLGIVLPPKATFFLPRLKNGILVQPLLSPKLSGS